MGVMRRAVISMLVAACLVIAGGARVWAAPDPSVSQLRSELDRVSAAQAGRLPPGALESIAYTIDVAERIAGSFDVQAQAWRARAASFLALAKKGEDPLVAQRGKLVMRGYQSPVSLLRQGYGIYIPPNYDPKQAYPLLIVLHGGSANGNLFLGVVLGNNMNWKEYPRHLWDDFVPQWTPNWIVVAPDGFGQVLWRWMGERDVLDVIEDVQRHYHVDPDRVILSGLSNGGVGAYGIGMRHASQFAAVLAIAGAPSWLQYAGGAQTPLDKTLLHPVSGMSLIENAIDTDFRYFHGRTDTGPMRPAFVDELGRVIRETGVPFQEKWYDLGHDLLYVVHRHGKIYDDLAGVRRERRPKEVRVVTGDYRANRQHWVTVTRLARYPELGRVRAVADAERIDVETRGVRAFSLDLRDAPLSPGERVTLRVDGVDVYAGARARLGHVIHFAREADGWRTGFPPVPANGIEKRPGLSGPITDAYFDAMLHVYGTADAASTNALKKAAERGAKGWPLWLWRVEQRVVADVDVTDAMMRAHHLVLYATPGSHRVLERIADRLPVKLDANGVTVGDRRFGGAGIGTKFVAPNPLALDRYVIVQAAPTVEAVMAGHKLPDFLPDWVVYDATTTRSRPRLLAGKRNAPRAQGFFDDAWALPTGSGKDTQPSRSAPRATPGVTTPSDVVPEGGDDTEPTAPDPDDRPPLPIPPAPKRPATATTFLAPAETQAGKAAREIAARVQDFPNLRAGTPGARWIVDPIARWSIRTNDACLASLREAGIRAQAWTPVLPTPVPTPVELQGRVDGVWFRMAHAERPLLMSCELAARLPALAAVLKRHGIRGVDVMSGYRDQPRTSFHTFGMALDIFRFWTLRGSIGVEAAFEKAPAHATCETPRPAGGNARTLLDIACSLAKSKVFSSVLTPNYNEGHRDHMHLDVRPDDPRTFVR